jgi:hypothetical protein
MKPNMHDSARADDARFDRLVDGELNEAERRELLAGLDNEPGGWRHCALAFLEAQCWKQEFGTIVKRETRTATAPGAIRRRAPWLGRLGTPLAVAASLLAALWLGATWQQARVGRPALPSGASTIGEVVQNAGSRAPVAPSPTKPAVGPWRVVTVLAPAGTQDARMVFDLPAVERDNVDQQWIQSLPSAMPDNVLQAFNRTGHQVRQRRELVPIPLKDGRRLVMPVDQVEVKYVGDKSY